MKITVRVPKEAYAFEEVVFDSLEEYESDYPKYVESFLKTQVKVKAVVDKSKNQPF
jgi:hypothetical protein